MKRLIALLLIPLLLTGCRESKQIDELSFVKMLAIDKSESGLTVTAGIQIPASKEKENSGSEVISVECETLSEGLNLLEGATEKKIFFGQINCILLGEEMARSGIIDTVDYLVRSDELRFDIPVIVIKASTAKKLVEDAKESEEHISQRIVKKLESNYSTSSSGEIQLSTLVEMLEDPFRAPYLPYITVKENDGFSVTGYAVFENDRVKEFLNKEDSLGINMLNGTVENYMTVAYIENKQVCLKISDFKSGIKMKNGVFYVDARFRSEVVQASAEIEKFDTELNGKVIEYQNGEVKEIIENSLKKLKELKCDVSVFGDTFHNVSPKTAEQYMNNWSETFPKIKIEINVSSKIDPSKTAGRPVKQGGD